MGALHICGFWDINKYKYIYIHNYSHPYHLNVILCTGRSQVPFTWSTPCWSWMRGWVAHLLCQRKGNPNRMLRVKKLSVWKGWCHLCDTSSEIDLWFYCGTFVCSNDLTNLALIQPPPISWKVANLSFGKLVLHTSSKSSTHSFLHICFLKNI
jgi:hypothetical protein